MVRRFSPHAREIITENPIRETWKLLRHYLDENETAEMLRYIHNLDGNQHKANIRKQAKQIAYCIRQGQEYFQAASSVTLATRPTLTYYGISSLAQALVLLNGGGDLSFDRLRHEKKHHHHGLELIENIYSIQRNKVSIHDFFEALECKPHFNGDQMWGLFGNFYRNLNPSSYLLRIEKHEQEKEFYSYDLQAFESFSNPNIVLLRNYKFNGSNLISMLPDLYTPAFSQYYLTQIRLARCNISAHYETRLAHVDPEPGEYFHANFFISTPFTEPLKRWLIQANQVPQKMIVDLKTLYEANTKDKLSAEMENGLNEAIQNNLRYEIAQDVGIGHARIKLRWRSDSTNPLGNIYIGKIPLFLSGETPFRIIESINGQHYLSVDEKLVFTEPIVFFALGFCLGMLSRYSPDIWMEIIDNNVEVAEAIDTLMSVMARKFPLLILDQMAGNTHRIRMPN